MGNRYMHGLSYHLKKCAVNLEKSPPHEENEEETDTADRCPFAQQRLQIDVSSSLSVLD